MTRTRCTLAILISIAIAADASAQFGPVIGLPTIGQGGIAFQAGNSRMKVAGFVPLGPPYPAVLPVTPTPFGFRQVAPAYLPYGYYGIPPIAPGFPFPGYGAIDQRIIVQVVTPPGVIVRGRRVAMPEESYDLAGIDLDVESPEKIWGKRPELAKEAAPKGEPVPAPKKVEVAAAPAKPPPAPPPPKIEPIPEGQRFVELGIAAFKTGEYGVALLRFRQAADAEPRGPRSLFLQAQACIAIGKYHEAVQLIQRGLKDRPDWPMNAFRPKLELYDNKDDIWKEHRDALERAQKRAPMNADYLFLLGYLEWFGGERDAAIAYFQQARALSADANWNDAFLKAAK